MIPKNVLAVFPSGSSKVFLAVLPFIQLWCSQLENSKCTETSEPKMFLSGTFIVFHQFIQDVPQLSVHNFYGFKFWLSKKSWFPQSLILLEIEAPYLLFSVYSLFTHTKDNVNRMDSVMQLVVQDKTQENYWGPPEGFGQLQKCLSLAKGCQGHSHPKLSVPPRGSNHPLLASTELAW